MLCHSLKNIEHNENLLIKMHKYAVNCINFVTYSNIKTMPKIVLKIVTHCLRAESRTQCEGVDAWSQVLISRDWSTRALH